MNCNDYFELINLELDGAITDEQQKALQAHISECENCRRTRDAMFSISSALAQETPPPAGFATRVMNNVRAQSTAVQPKKKKKTKVYYIRYAAAAAALALVLLAGMRAGVNRKSMTAMTMGSAAPAEAAVITEETAEEESLMLDSVEAASADRAESETKTVEAPAAPAANAGSRETASSSATGSANAPSKSAAAAAPAASDEAEADTELSTFSFFSSASAADEQPTTFTVRRTTEYFRDEDDRILLEYWCDLPELSDTPMADKVNAALRADAELFETGDPSYDMPYGKLGYLQDAKEFQKEYGGESFPTYSLTRNVTLQRLDSTVLSFACDDYSYIGGVHGYTARTGCTFSLQTGARLSLSDLGRNAAEFKSLCADLLIEQGWGLDPVYYFFDGWEETVAGLPETDNWVLTEDSLVFFANPYDIAPYAAGRIDFVIPLSVLGDALKSEFIPAEAAAEGYLEGAFTDGTEPCLAFVDDKTEGAGQAVSFYAREGALRNVQIRRLSGYFDYDDPENFIYVPMETILFADFLPADESVCVRTYIPDVVPNLQISYIGANGEETYYISENLRDGGLLLIPADDPNAAG